MEITIPNASVTLKGVFFVHLILTVWSSLCTTLAHSFLLYNGFLLITILWSLHQRESEEAPFMALCINVLSIVFDIVNIAVNWPVSQSSSVRFGVAMAIFNLILRPITSYLLYRIVQDRAGSYGSFGLPTGFEGIFGGRRSPYEDIDQPSQPNPSTNIDTDRHGVNASSSPPSEALFTT